MKSKPYNSENPNPSAKCLNPGDRCVILQPHLWSGATATVEVVYMAREKMGLHLLKVEGKGGATFRAEAWACQLRLVDDDPLGLASVDVAEELNSL